MSELEHLCRAESLEAENKVYRGEIVRLKEALERVKGICLKEPRRIMDQQDFQILDICKVALRQGGK